MTGSTLKRSLLALISALLCSSNSGETITGTIYCDNYFEFYFNGELVATDPMTFTPHNAVAVAFVWDEVSDKHYAVLCQDYASDSGYEYIETGNPGLGDGAFIAEFSDGTVTSADWKHFVANYGPTEASEAAGCASNNLNVCEVEEIGNPDNWFGVDFDFSDWAAATLYTAAEAGWGRAPSWIEGSGCCTATSPLDRSSLELNGGCSVNYDSALGQAVSAEVTELECLNPREYFGDSSAEFLWGSELERDNRVLFRLTVPQDALAATPTSVSTTTAPYATAPSASARSTSPTMSPTTTSGITSRPCLGLLVVASAVGLFL